MYSNNTDSALLYFRGNAFYIHYFIDSNKRNSTIQREHIFAFQLQQWFHQSPHIDMLYVHYESCCILFYVLCTGKYYKMVIFSWGLCYMPYVINTMA